MSRALLAAAVLAGALLAGGCGQAEPEHQRRADWVIPSQLQFMSPGFQSVVPPLPHDRFRMWFPYVSGDLYGAATLPAYSQPVVDAQYRFEIDLNEGHPDLVRALEHTRFSGGWLTISPAEARIARLSPFILEADGIEPLGTAEWLDEANRRLMLVYFDRPATITGSAESRGQTVRFDVHAAKAGYVWIARPPAAPPGAEGSAVELVYTAVPPPQSVKLAVALEPD